MLYTVNQLSELTASAVKDNIDIMCKQKHWYYNSEREIKSHDSSNR